MAKIDNLKKPTEKSDLHSVLTGQKFSEESISKTSASDLTLKIVANSIAETQVKNEFGISLQDMVPILKKDFADCTNFIKTNISENLQDEALKDLSVIYNKILPKMLPFVCESMRENLLNMEVRVEKKLAVENKFFKMEESDKRIFFNEEIIKFIPEMDINNYKSIINEEIKSAFSIYDVVLKEIKAQDFIITRDFLNIQYRLGEYFVVNFPDFLKKTNEIFVNHIATDYIYEREDKFTGAEGQAIKDYEEDGFRINMMHGSLRDNGCATIFIRKNVHGYGKIEDPSYFMNLFSNLKPLTAGQIKNYVNKDGEFYHKEKKISYMSLIDGKLASTDGELTKLKEKWIKEMSNIVTGAPDSLGREMSFFFVGKTGCGKTTAMRQFILEKPAEQNRMTIEDTGELWLPDTISYITNKNYGISDIFVATLRENPTSVYVGETREGQVLMDILEMSLTAHGGSTLHAADMNKCLARIKLMCGNLMPTDTLYELLCSTIGMFCFMADRKVIQLYLRNTTPYNGNFWECYDNVIEPYSDYRG